jgi:HPt (histidine-containing phosphotransfer) domain-containing protein
MDPLDRTAVLDRFGGDVALLRQIADLFRDSSGPWLKEIHESLAAGDLAQVKRVAHTLKGSVGNFLATRAQESAFKVQQLAAAGNAAPLPDAIARLDAEVAAVLAALEVLLAAPTREMP